ncbi:endopeptidase La [Haliscomenobacter hydrossis]|uniref:Lon protease n=2 Tax=Haliscomenobacter TaxID=2349 RepID=F4KT77_HALH1|nr:endopeptidase La [Haliscomenobacter hydrossis]AEE51134.1 anti-sigma H sporulation factor, LonB [Haliscomenobacter hydrossis DSM 1100]
MFDALLVNRELDDDSDFLPMLSMDEGQDTIADDQYPGFLPILALKNTVLFPGVVIPITVGRDKSIRAINEAYESAKLIGVLSQKDVKIENPGAEDLYPIGTVAQIIKILRMPDGTTTAILRGQKRFELGNMLRETPYMEGSIRVLPHPENIDNIEFEAQISTIMDLSQRIVELSPNIPQEAIAMLRSIQDNSFLLNFISSNMNSKVEVKQQILEYDDLSQKASLVIHEMGTQLQLLELKDKIETRVRGDLEKQQRDYFLSQQLKTIQEELGQNPQEEEVSTLESRAKAKLWSEASAKHFDRELTKLRRMNPQVAEYSIQMNYLELMIDLPWQQYSEDNFDLKRVKKVLDHDHFGLEKVKERILEHLAVLKLKGDMKAPILCLVGPPGVGKTSLGRSIATALDREFVQMSLGGLHDESEIRGHRKTYIGALPGRIIQSMKKAGSGNPVFLLDEIDKVGRDFRGDPSSALLEVLDPTQNDHFHDNYLEVDYDLSKVLFIATANGLSTIQPALLDRMEIIEIGGYSMEEKVEIAKRHLIPDQLKEHGLKASQVKFGKKALRKMVQEYTRESGVRSLNRQIAAVMRHVAKQVAMDETPNANIDEAEVASVLGITPYAPEMYKEVPSPGVAVGLAWTQMGGEILFVESSVSKGSGRMILTGNLGEVMKESATTAMSFIKAHAEELGVDTDKIEKSDVHVHIPEGAIPKDGPSAGVTMLTSLASIFTGKPVRPFLAMTGEITLRGKVLPVGGIKEKILAAKRAGMKEIILCKENRRHVEDINTDYITGLKFHYVGNMQEVLARAIS